MQTTLLVLAAGMGSRYGGLKQIDPVGPSGETVLDYAVFDALRVGFSRVVFVIRRDFEEVFRQQIGAKYAGRVVVDYVFQALDALPEESTGEHAAHGSTSYALPAGREKPWGTGHAVWCAREAITGPFAVINADDFYGADSFARLAAFLQAAGEAEAGRGAAEPAPFAMVGFRLANTLSEHGAVSRGVCTARADGALVSIEEHTGILASEVGVEKKYSGDEIVSMNCWGFTPAVFAGLDRQFRAFLGAHGSELKSEFYLPAAVSTMIGRGEATVQVLPTESAWFGVTYREDKPRVMAAIAGLVAAGKYPAKLF